MKSDKLEKTIRISISSPGDVEEEREKSRVVIERLVLCG
jgi:hypothetical protein